MFVAFGISDQGCIRSNNEDYFISDPQAGIFILADGMGGARAGEHASQLSVEHLYTYLKAAPELNVESLESGFAEANRAVRSAAAADRDLQGMGTTLVAAVQSGPNEMLVCSVGDSRAYLFSGGALDAITEDHTWVAEVGTKLGLTAGALQTHPMRHVLTMAVGASDELRIHSYRLCLSSGDQVLLCSDGLHGVLDEQIIACTLSSEKSLADKSHYLVEAAKDRGGPDNITAVLIQLV